MLTVTRTCVVLTFSSLHPPLPLFTPFTAFPLLTPFQLPPCPFTHSRYACCPSPLLTINTHVLLISLSFTDRNDDTFLEFNSRLFLPCTFHKWFRSLFLPDQCHITFFDYGFTSSLVWTMSEERKRLVFISKFSVEGVIYDASTISLTTLPKSTGTPQRFGLRSVVDTLL